MLRNLYAFFALVFALPITMIAQEDHEEFLRRKYPIPAIAKRVLGDSIKLGDLGPRINTEFTDMSPLVSEDGQTLYYWIAKITQQNNNDFGSQMIYISKLTDQGWGKSKKAEEPLNKKDLNAVISIFNDGKNILIRDDNTNSLGISQKSFSVLTKTGDSYNNKQNVKIDRYNKLANGPFHGATMSSDGSYMILYFAEKEGSKINDLYLAKRKKGWDYAEPTLLKGLNSNKDEFAPFLAPDNKTLFFTSTRFGGLGAEDIYVSERLDDTWLRWSKPINVGYPINSHKYDGNFSVDRNGNAFLSTNRHTHSGIDIFGLNPVTIKEKPPVPQDTMVIVQGNIISTKTKQNVQVAGVINIQYEDIEMHPMEVPSYEDGTYIMEIPLGHKYKIWPGIENYLTENEEYVDLRKVMDGEYVHEQDLYVTPIEIGTKVRLENIFFDYGKASLRSESFPELNKVVKFMNDYSSVVIEIAGHTDSDGGNSFNKDLSQRRANSVMNYIITQGVSSSRISAVGYGEEKPVATNATEEGKQLNRRVEFEILKK